MTDRPDDDLFVPPAGGEGTDPRRSGPRPAPRPGGRSAPRPAPRRAPRPAPAPAAEPPAGPPAVEPDPVVASQPVLDPEPDGGGAGAARRSEADAGDGEWFDLPDEPSGPRGWVVALVVAVLVVLVALGAGWFWYQRQVDPPGGPGRAVQVEVPPGSSTSAIGSILESRGVVANATVFSFYAGRKDAGPFEAGVYRLRENSDLDLVLSTLAEGPVAPTPTSVTKVTIPEGYTVAQTLARIHEKVPRFSVADLQGALDRREVPSPYLPAGSTNYEGLLFPATYEVGPKTTPVELLTRMASEMETRLGALDVPGAQARIKQEWGLDLTPYQLLTVASLIQAEAAVPADAPKIAAVTYNRLRDGMPLQYDATSAYEAVLQGRKPTDIDLEKDSPYNTRTHPGLPPTPISAPGEFALEGALEPASGPWLYFVVTGEDEVTFTETYQEFLAAKDLCRKRNLGCG